MADQKSNSNDANPAPNQKAELSTTELDAVTGGGFLGHVANVNNRANEITKDLIKNSKT